ncbi:di-trans,poly-cis-decaprenylcistransferase [Aggregicoccus sp. 17bor-14]|nr:di-trans,poly-cis-decaprenylcistransferase [Simulacricoccus sp. 17bor-14]MRI87967.1 di-trans,poly-cis-decaprenylcistransferase [Aggregicoccus sp. 17bor-14]
MQRAPLRPVAEVPRAAQEDAGLHVAIIMDGNGRWAQARGLPRTAGHAAGVAAVRRVVEAAPAQRIAVLTLYAFSSDNWKRPGPEVRALLRLMETYLRTERANCVEKGVRVEVLGRRDRLPSRVQAEIAAAEAATAAGTVLCLRLAIDYSSRDAIVRAAESGPRSRRELACGLAPGSDRPAPDVDLLIRTGGEQRLSDFLLWESAYAELYFTPVAWPDFDAAALGAAVTELGRRQRRFGGLEASTGAR